MKFLDEKAIFIFVFTVLTYFYLDRVENTQQLTHGSISVASQTEWLNHYPQLTKAKMKHSIFCALFIAFRLSQSFASTQSHKDADGYVNVHVADSDSPVNTDTDTGTAGDSHGGTAHVSGGAHGQADKSREPLLSPVAVCILIDP